MKKVSMLIILLLTLIVTGCNPNIPVTKDSEIEIKKEINELKADINSVPIFHIEDVKRTSVSIETSLGEKNKKILFLGTDLVMYEEQEVLLSYLVSNVKNEEWASKYNVPIPSKKSYFTNEDKTGILWEQGGWHINLIPSVSIPEDQLVEWSKNFRHEPKLAEEIEKWFALDKISFIKEIPGENVRYNIGMFVKNPEQDILNKTTNSLYVVALTDIEEITNYQINYTIIPKEDFKEDWVKNFSKMKLKEKEFWFNQKNKELYWEDDFFVYHMHDNVTNENVNYFTIEDYLKFTHLIEEPNK